MWGLRSARLTCLVLVGTLDRDRANADMFHQPIEINRTGVGAGHQSVTTEVVQPIGVETAGYDGVVNVLGVFQFEQPRDFLCEADATSFEQRTDRAVFAAHDFGRPFLVFLLLAARPLHQLKRVAEWAVAEVVQQGRENRHFGALAIEVVADLALDDFDQFARGMEDADAMCETGMGRAGEGELRRTELLDTAQALELSDVEQPPCEFVEIAVLSEYDEAVHGVADPLVAGIFGRGAHFAHVSSPRSIRTHASTMSRVD